MTDSSTSARWGLPLRKALLIAAVLLAVTLVAPLWSTHMEAPQYKGDEALQVKVYAGSVTGDINEITVLNQYVGVHLPLDTPELKASPWVLGGLLLLALVALAAPARRRRLAAVVLLLAMVTSAVGGAALLQYRLYQMGHVRDDPILVGVEDFTPPIFGTAKIANFSVTMVPEAGGWAFLAAVLLVGWGVFTDRRRIGVSAETSSENGKGSGEVTRSVVSMVLGFGLLLTLFSAGLVMIPRYQAANPSSALQRSDANRVRLDDLYLDLTLVTPSFLEGRNLDRYFGDRDPETVLPVLVGLNTHTGDIGHMREFPGDLSLIGPDGSRYPAITEPIVMSSHHNAYMLLFPARGNTGERFLDYQEGVLAVEATEMGMTPLRRFEWDLPVVSSTSGGGLAARLMLTVALISALIVVLSPCALELTLYYAAIISCTVTEGEREAATAGGLDPSLVGRRRVLVNLASFVGGFTLLYAASGATVGLIGAGVRQPLGAYSGAIQIFSGTVILLFAIRVAGIDRWVWTRLRPHLGFLRGESATLMSNHGGNGPMAKLAGGLKALRMRGQARRAAGHGMRARDSFLVGLGLSSACLSCMGGAVLYPLLVYAGITSWFSGMITLGLYSLAIAVPMVFIALGFFRIRMSLAKRMGVNRVLRLASATMLAGIGLLILSDNERIITDVTFRVLAEISQWSA